MATVNTFEELRVWQAARTFCKQIAVVVQRSPTDQRFFDQLRRSSGSVMDNIAEGFGRSSRKEFIQFLFIANGSVMEARSQVYRAFDYGFLSKAELDTLLTNCDHISGMIFKLIEYLKRTNISGLKHK